MDKKTPKRKNKPAQTENGKTAKLESFVAENFRIYEVFSVCGRKNCEWLI